MGSYSEFERKNWVLLNTRTRRGRALGSEYPIERFALLDFTTAQFLGAWGHIKLKYPFGRMEGRERKRI